LRPYIIYYHHEEHGSVHVEIIAETELDALSEFEKKYPELEAIKVKPKNMIIG